MMCIFMRYSIAFASNVSGIQEPVSPSLVVWGIKHIGVIRFRFESLHLEKLLQLLHRIIRILDRVSGDSGIDIDLMVVSAHLRLVAEEMNGLVVYPANALLRLEMLEAVCLVPTGGEYVEGYLASNRVSTKKLSASASLPVAIREGAQRASGYTDVRPKSGNCFLKASTIFSRIPC